MCPPLLRAEPPRGADGGRPLEGAIAPRQRARPPAPPLSRRPSAPARTAAQPPARCARPHAPAGRQPHLSGTASPRRHPPSAPRGGSPSPPCTGKLLACVATARRAGLGSKACVCPCLRPALPQRGVARRWLSRPAGPGARPWDAVSRNLWFLSVAEWQHGCRVNSLVATGDRRGREGRNQFCYQRGIFKIPSFKIHRSISEMRQVTGTQICFLGGTQHRPRPAAWHPPHGPWDGAHAENLKSH